MTTLEPKTTYKLNEGRTGADAFVIEPNINEDGYTTRSDKTAVLMMFYTDDCWYPGEPYLFPDEFLDYLDENDKIEVWE